MVDKFMMEFQKLAVMIHHIPKERITFIFIEGLAKPLRVMVKVSYPKTLDNSI